MEQTKDWSELCCWNWTAGDRWWRLRCPGALAARLWPLNFGSVKNYSVGPDVDPPKGRISVVTEAPVSSLLEAPFFGTTACRLLVSHLAWWLTWITFGSPSFPVKLPNLRRGCFLMGCAFPDTPRGGKMWENRQWVCVWWPSKMPTLLVLAGSQGCYMYLKKSLLCLRATDWDCGHTEHTWLSFWFSQLYIFREKKMPKAWWRVSQHEHSSNS